MSALASLILGAVLVTSFISGIFGMAGGIILMGLYGWVLPVRQAMILHGITQFASNGYRAFLHREHIHWPVLGGYVVGAVLCLAGFTWLAYVPDKTTLFLALGIIPVANYAAPPSVALDITKRGMAPVCGFIVTALQLTAGVSGPLLDIFYVKTGLTRHQIVASKALTQSLGHTLKLVYFGALTGEMGSPFGDLPPWLFAAVVPVAFLGTTLAARYLNALSDASFRVWSQRIILAIGIVYLWRGVDGLIAAPVIAAP